MKKLLIFIVGMLSAVAALAATNLSLYRGVYANDSAEAVITDSVCIVYFQKDSTMQAILEVPASGLRHKTVFAPDIATVEPYEMDDCRTDISVGKCLQQWRLGVDYGADENQTFCEINTNRHMFVYLVSPYMVYIRAAAARNNNKGTLFSQNIRMMKNNNTGEYTMHIMPGNLAFCRNDLEIDNAKFQPNTCTFSPDGGIYWSLISFEPGNIQLNGCGETYQVPRRQKDSGIKEWIKYEPYSTDSELPLLR